MPIPADALKKAQSIVPDPYAEWFTEHPLIGKLASVFSPAVDPHHEFGLTDVLTAATPFVGRGAKLAKESLGLENPATAKLLEMLEEFNPAMPSEQEALRSDAFGGVTGRYLGPKPKLNIPEGFTLDKSKGFTGAPRPQNAMEASLAQEGFPGSFGRSPANDYNRSQMERFYWNPLRGASGEKKPTYRPYANRYLKDFESKFSQY